MFALHLLEETTMGPNVTWLLWVALGFFALMVVIGWLSSRNQKPEAPAGAEKRHSDEEHH